MPAKRRLDYTFRALNDLAEIRRWLSQPGSGMVAIRRIKAVRADINRLARQPCLHKVGRHPSRREMITRGYLVLYQVLPDTGLDATAGNVMILRVYGPGQSRDDPL